MNFHLEQNVSKSTIKNISPLHWSGLAIAGGHIISSQALEVSGRLGAVTRTNVHIVSHIVKIAVILTSIALTVTVRVNLSRIRHQDAVVFVIVNTIIVIVVVTSVSNTIPKSRETIDLVRVSDVWTVVHLIWNSVTVSIFQTVAGVPHQVVVVVLLSCVAVIPTVVTSITHQIVISVFLGRVLYKGAVVNIVSNSIAVNIVIACIPNAILTSVLLIRIGVGRTVIADIADTIPNRVCLVRVLDGWEVV